MSWRDNLQPASWRGVAFSVERTVTSGGRRIKEIDRWQKRTITVDQGPKLVSFTIEAFIIQNSDNDFDYFGQRDKLIDKLQNVRGPGILVHPFHGRLKVHSRDWSIEESFDEGGIARFTIDFDLEQTSLFPGETKDSKKVVDAQATASTNLSIDNFINTMNAAAVFLKNLISPITNMMLKIQTAIGSVNNVVRSTVNTALGVISTAISTLQVVLNAPCDLYNTCKDACDAFGNLVGMAGEVISSGVIGGCSGTTRGNAYTLDGDSIPESLGTSVVNQIVNVVDDLDQESIFSSQEENLLIIINIFKLQLLIFAARVGIRIDYSSQDSLFDILELLRQAFDDFMENILGEQLTLDNTDVFVAAEQMKITFIDEMNTVAETLVKEIDYQTPNDILSTLVLSYNKYEDIDRCAEIFNKNRIFIKHPGFIPENSTIRILEE